MVGGLMADTWCRNLLCLVLAFTCYLSEAKTLIVMSKLLYYLNVPGHTISETFEFMFAFVLLTNFRNCSEKTPNHRLHLSRRIHIEMKVFLA